MNLFLAGIVCFATLTVAFAAEPAADAQETTIYAKGTTQTFDSMIAALSQNDVVFVGENHDHKRGHAMELEILKALNTRAPFGLALEMFERDTQMVLDEYLSGVISESSFLQASRPWPNYKDDYRPMIEFCREKKLPVIATNAPRRYVSIVSRKGPEALQELPRPARAFLAPLPYSLEMPEGYSKQLDEIFGGAHGSTAPAPTTPGMPSPANMKAAQGLWDATMADSILRGMRAYRIRKVVHVNGSMHSDSGFGIVDRLRRARPKLKIGIVTIRPSESYPNVPAELSASSADFVVVTPVEAKTPPVPGSK